MTSFDYDVYFSSCFFPDGFDTFVVTKALAWMDAEKQCSQWDGSLATVTSQVNNDIYHNQMKMKGVTTALIGLNDIKEEGAFEWIGAHLRNSSFRNWAAPNPNNFANSEDCAQYYPEGNWNDLPCSRPMAFLCQVPVKTQVCKKEPPPLGYYELGCYADSSDSSDSAIPEYWPMNNGEDYVELCYNVALSQGYKVFAVSIFGADRKCWTSANAQYTYEKHGKAHGCKDGYGGELKLSVYKIVRDPSQISFDRTEFHSGEKATLDVAMDIVPNSRHKYTIQHVIPNHPLKHDNRITIGDVDRKCSSNVSLAYGKDDAGFNVTVTKRYKSVNQRIEEYYGLDLLVGEFNNESRQLVAMIHSNSEFLSIETASFIVNSNDGGDCVSNAHVTMSPLLKGNIHEVRVEMSPGKGCFHNIEDVSITLFHEKDVKVTSVTFNHDCLAPTTRSTEPVLGAKFSVLHLWRKICFRAKLLLVPVHKSKSASYLIFESLYLVQNINGSRRHKLYRKDFTVNPSKTYEAPLRTQWYSCKFHKGNAVTSSDNNKVWIGYTTSRKHCIAECTKRKQKQVKINGVIVSNEDNPGCWCVIRMMDINRRAPNDQEYRTCYLEERPVTDLLDHLVGIWSLSYTNGHTDQCTITPNGHLTIKSQGVMIKLQASDDPVVLPTSEGWLLAKGDYKGGVREYYRYNETLGKLEAVLFCSKHEKCGVYKGTKKHFCCTAKGTRLLDITKRPPVFVAASGDISQSGLTGVQAKGVSGTLLSDGHFIFTWKDGDYRKMVLTSNKGDQLKAGYMTGPAMSWKYPSTWTDAGKYYKISNFHGFRSECPTSNAYWNGSPIDTTYTNTWQECSSACGADSRCYKWDWYPSTYTYDIAFRKRCVFKPENSVLTPWNHGMFSGLQNCQSGNKERTATKPDVCVLKFGKLFIFCTYVEGKANSGCYQYDLQRFVVTALASPMMCILGMNRYSLNIYGTDSKQRFLTSHLNSTHSFTLMSNMSSVKSMAGFVASKTYSRSHLFQETMDTEFTVEGVGYSVTYYGLTRRDYGHYILLWLSEKDCHDKVASTPHTALRSCTEITQYCPMVRSGHFWVFGPHRHVKQKVYCDVNKKKQFERHNLLTEEKPVPTDKMFVALWKIGMEFTISIEVKIVDMSDEPGNIFALSHGKDEILTGITLVNSTLVNLFFVVDRQPSVVDINTEGFNVEVGLNTWTTFEVSQHKMGTGNYTIRSRIDGVTVYEYELGRHAVREMVNLKLFGNKCPDCKHTIAARNFFVKNELVIS